MAIYVIVFKKMLAETICVMIKCFHTLYLAELHLRTWRQCGPIQPGDFNLCLMEC